MSKKLSVMDAFFLAGESREAMMHVGALLPFSPAPDTPPTWLRSVVDELRDVSHAESPWNLRLRWPGALKSPIQSWVADDRFDLDYHVRRSALPSPGDERELGVLVSRLHSGQIDFHRPPWEVHFIEGLTGGRFALYFKVHHSLMDGYTGAKLLASSLSSSPDERDTPMFFLQPPPPRPPREPHVEGEAATLAALSAVVRDQASAARDVGASLRRLLRAGRERDRELVAPNQAPRSILNRRISRNRRFATLQLDLERVKAIGKAADATLNDVCLALVGTSLRRLLGELDALPAEPLVTMCPVNIRPKDDPGGGNAVGAILASLATDLDDPIARLHATAASTRRAKAELAGMSRTAIIQYAALLMAPLSLAPVPGLGDLVRPAFNLVVSNVPGPQQPLYFRGARLEASYPLSIPYHGNALNITIQSYAGTLNVGFTGCRDAVPKLQRLAVYAGEAADELEALLV
ncbi:MAG TPA: wax ester/triacylglycerol synthase family O-acyltransferase [Kofleriaceae bacterium]|nr:wax ester/triacylglycerol synthase family O-acyltransferase [Kofleriaceae bacterium]